MGQQTSTADRPPAPARSRVAPTVLAAAAAIATLLGATALVWWTSLPGHHVSSGAQADSLSIDTLNVFDSDAALLPNQVSTATVTNVGTDPVTITDIAFSLTPPPSSGGEAPQFNGGSDSPSPTETTSPPATVPLEIFPGENCKGATVQPKQDCMVSVRYTNPGQIFHGSLIVTTADGSTALGETGANTEPLDSILANPYVVDFGTRPVGTTSPAQTVTISASPADDDFQVVGVSVVDTVPTPGDRADYHIASDGCTGVDLQLPNTGGIGTIGGTSDGISTNAVAAGPVPNCTIQVTDTPGGAGNRPAFLNVAYCSSGTIEIGSVFQPAEVVGSTTSDPTTTSDAPTTTTSAGPPPVDPNIFCPNGDHEASFHQIVALNGAGQASTTTTAPPTTTPPTTTTTTPTTTPPPTTTPVVTPQVFAPTLIATPPLAPAGRTTQVTGTGFPVNTPVTFALVALGTAPDANLRSVPGLVDTTTDGNGNFTDKVMLIMPHLPPGQYEILAQAQFGKVPLTASVDFLVAPGSQEPPKFAGRH